MIGSLRGNVFSEKEFWKIIEMLDWDFVGDDDNVVKIATLYLSKKSEDFIRKFHQMLVQKLRSLQICEKFDTTSKTPESFLFTRCAAIATGKKYYNSVLSNPIKIRENAEFSALTNLCNNAMKLKSGQDFTKMSAFKYYSGDPSLNFG